MSATQAGNRAVVEPAAQKALRTLNGVLGIVVILSVGILLNPSWGAWTQLAIVPLIAAGVLAVGITGTRIMLRVRGHRTDRLAAGLRPLLGQDWDSKRELSASRFSKGRPHRVKIDYPDSIGDQDPEWRKRVEDMVRQRMEVEQVIAKWDTRRGRVVIEAKTSFTKRDLQEENETAAQQRVHDILRPMFGTSIKVTVTDWQEPEKEAIES